MRVTVVRKRVVASFSAEFDGGGGGVAARRGTGTVRGPGSS